MRTSASLDWGTAFIKSKSLQGEVRTRCVCISSGLTSKSSRAFNALSRFLDSRDARCSLNCGRGAVQCRFTPEGGRENGKATTPMPTATVESHLPGEAITQTYASTRTLHDMTHGVEILRHFVVVSTVMHSAFGETFFLSISLISCSTQDM